MEHRIIYSIAVSLLLAGCIAGQVSTLPTAISSSNTEISPIEDWKTSTLVDRTLITLPADEAASTVQSTPTGQVQTATTTATLNSELKITRTPTPTKTSKPTLGVDAWKFQPVIPSIDEKAVQIYQRGLELGNNPRAFSKIGDCGSTPTWFLGDFDRGLAYYRLGEYQNLAAVIEEFKGSFDRTSLAARSGFNASALFTPLWSDLKYCQTNESPLACEYRVHRPVIAFIMLGANDVWHPEEFEPQMRKIIEYSIDNGVIPILSTKADNQEKDYSINSTIARLAMEYDVPLWNFWRAVDPLPGHGLQEDLVHLTWGGNLFDDPAAMTQAWPIRNLTALQTLDAIWRKATNQTQQ